MSAARSGAGVRVAAPRGEVPGVPLDEAFFERSVHEAARDLIGCALRFRGVGGVIVEVESYHAEDPACHAYIGRTERNAVLFGRPGLAYVYFSYGVHNLLNAVAQPEGEAAAVLIRALEPRWGLEEMSDSVELLVSEVVTNAVRYTSRPVTLRLLRTDVLRCEVGDDVPQLPRLRQARATDEGGRGLYVVNKMARRWGATRLSTGKVVWFELNRG